MTHTVHHPHARHHRFERLHSAFAEPRGLLGAMAASVLAVESRRVNRAVVDELRLGPDDSVIEVGCGPGNGARCAARAVGRDGAVVAVDPSGAMLGVARLIARLARSPRVTWLQGSAEDLPVVEPATVVFAVNSWHHWQDHERAVEQLGRAVVPGGRVVIVERTDRSRGHKVHAMDEAGVARVVELLGRTFPQVDRSDLEVGRDHFVLVTARAAGA